MKSYQKVQVWVIDYKAHDPNQSEVLCLKTNQKRGHFWQPITGSVEDGEDLLTAAIRETHEETGLVISVETMRNSGFHFSFTGQWGYATEFVFYFEHPKTEIQIDPKEHVEFQWVSIEEALSRVKHASNQQGLKKSLQQLA